MFVQICDRDKFEVPFKISTSDSVGDIDWNLHCLFRQASRVLCFSCELCIITFESNWFTKFIEMQEGHIYECYIAKKTETFGEFQSLESNV